MKFAKGLLSVGKEGASSIGKFFGKDVKNPEGTSMGIRFFNEIVTPKRVERLKRGVIGQDWATQTSVAKILNAYNNPNKVFCFKVPLDDKMPKDEELSVQQLAVKRILGTDFTTLAGNLKR